MGTILKIRTSRYVTFKTILVGKLLAFVLGAVCVGTFAVVFTALVDIAKQIGVLDMYAWFVISLAVSLTTLTVMILIAPGAFWGLFYPRLLGKYAEKSHTSRIWAVEQIKLSPRLQEGWRAFLDHADDLGLLELTQDALVFKGDSVYLEIPYQQITSVSKQSGGARIFWMPGIWIRLVVDDLPDYNCIDLCDASSWTLPEHWAKTHLLFKQLTDRAGLTERP